MASKTLLPRSISRHLSLQPSRFIPTLTRSFHSHNHPPPPSPFTPTESLILSKAAPHIPTHGFTNTTLSLGAKEAGYIDASINLFPTGPFALVQWHLYTQREALKDHTSILAETGVGKKVKALTWERLMGNQELIDRWQEALALMAQPTNIPPSISELSKLSDEIWYLAGDISVDSSWYTKRASLSTIYATTEVFMTTDKSAGFKDTREFMERRFRDSQVLGGVVGSVGQWAGFTVHAGINVARSLGVRI